MSPIRFDEELSESEICIRDYDCLAWNDDMIYLTLDSASLGSPVKKLINTLGHTGRVCGVMHGLISDFSENCIKVSDSSTGEPIAEYKNLDELVADGWAVDE